LILFWLWGMKLWDVCESNFSDIIELENISYWTTGTYEAYTFPYIYSSKAFLLSKTLVSLLQRSLGSKWAPVSGHWYF
jgi:hypothetical protein